MITCITCTHNSKNIVGERAGISPVCNVPDDYEICKSYQPVPVKKDEPAVDEKVTVCNVEGFTEIPNDTITVSEEDFTAARGDPEFVTDEETCGAHATPEDIPKPKGRKGRKAARPDENEEYAGQ